MPNSYPFDAMERSQTGPFQTIVEPVTSLLASMLEGRLAMDAGDPLQGPLPEGVKVDLRPQLPRIDRAALHLYMQRQKVESFPLLYTMLAMAQPN